MGVPPNSSIYRRMSHIPNHRCFGVPHIYGNPPIYRKPMNTPRFPVPSNSPKPARTLRSLCFTSSIRAQAVAGSTSVGWM